MKRVDANAVALVMLGQLCSGVGQLEGADAHLVASFEHRVGSTLSIDEDAVGAVQVSDAMSTRHLVDTGMVAGDLWMVEDDRVIRLASNE